MITSPDNEGVILIGGSKGKSDGPRNNVLELRVGANSWNDIGELKIPRNAHVAIPIPKWP